MSLNAVGYDLKKPPRVEQTGALENTRYTGTWSGKETSGFLS
jgi:hypothetical protein